MSDAVYVTTTIPYVNAKPHVGFALELVQADAIARHHRLLGKRVRFQTGTDENAFSNVLSARASGVPVEDLVSENSGHFQDLCDSLEVSTDVFQRTADPTHHVAVQHFLSHLPPEDLYLASYSGFYCPRCEDFFLQRDLDGRLCPEHGTPIEEIEETNHFFRLSRYEELVRDAITSRRLLITPRSREREVLRFVDRGLRDFSISRSAARSGGWGVPFPGDPTQVVYVWVDALVNYLSGLGYPDSDGLRQYWSPDTSKIQVIGKNVWKFHAIYWPALLLAAGLSLPDQIVVHGFLTTEGRKISKSGGNSVDPTECVDRFGVDAVRYFLLAHVRPFEDTDFSVRRVEEVYTTDLANGLGNLCTRLTTLSEKVGLPGYNPPDTPVPPEGYHEHVSGFRFDLALRGLWEEVAEINRGLAEERPWDHLRADRPEAAIKDLRAWIERLHALAYWLVPFLPSTGSSILDSLTRPLIRKSAPLFPRLS